MELKKLANYKHIVIQCHDIPDADSICSGFALQCFFHSLGAHASLVYGGGTPISKPNLVMLLQMLKIHIAHVDELPPGMDLLITVDCQRGAGNVHHFGLPENTDVVMIDHHRAEAPENENTLIWPHLASCATVVWELLNRAGYEMDSRVQTALYYGLYSDTNGLSELRHPLDRDLADLPNDAGMVKKLKSSAVTIDELSTIGGALTNSEIFSNIGLFRAEPCDANLLGFVGDIAQQVAHMDCCVIYCAQKHGLKLSIRCSSREIMANEIAEFLCRDTGSGGGNLEKAGGLLSFSKIAEIGGGEPEQYLKSRIYEYLNNYDMVYAGENDEDFEAMQLYKKLPIPVGFVNSTDIFPDGAKITVRTLEGDVDTNTGDGIYFMIGVQGEVYPIKKERFEAGYNVTGEPYLEKGEYQPMVIDRASGERHGILKSAMACVPKGDNIVRARVLDKETKVFTNWDTEKYFHGSKGDYLVAKEGRYEDCYIVRRDIFLSTYKPVRKRQ